MRHFVRFNFFNLDTWNSVIVKQKEFIIKACYRLSCKSDDS